MFKLGSLKAILWSPHDHNIDHSGQNRYKQWADGQFHHSVLVLRFHSQMTTNHADCNLSVIYEGKMYVPQPVGRLKVSLVACRFPQSPIVSTENSDLSKKTLQLLSKQEWNCVTCNTNCKQGQFTFKVKDEHFVTCWLQLLLWRWMQRTRLKNYPKIVQ